MTLLWRGKKKKIMGADSIMFDVDSLEAEKQKGV